MPWDGSAQAGFTTGKPWLPLSPDWKTRNVKAMTADEGSILNLYRQLIALRRESRVLQLGDYVPLGAEDGVLAYARRLGEERLTVILNLAHERRRASLPSPMPERVLVSTAPGSGSRPADGRIELGPDEGVILAD